MPPRKIVHHYVPKSNPNFKISEKGFQKYAESTLAKYKKDKEAAAATGSKFVDNADFDEFLKTGNMSPGLLNYDHETYNNRNIFLPKYMYSRLLNSEVAKKGSGKHKILTDKKQVLDLSPFNTASTTDKPIKLSKNTIREAVNSAIDDFNSSVKPPDDVEPEDYVIKNIGKDLVVDMTVLTDKDRQELFHSIVSNLASSAAATFNQNYETGYSHFGDQIEKAKELAAQTPPKLSETPDTIPISEPDPKKPAPPPMQLPDYIKQLVAEHVDQFPEYDIKKRLRADNVGNIYPNVPESALIREIYNQGLLNAKDRAKEQYIMMKYSGLINNQNITPELRKQLQDNIDNYQQIKPRKPWLTPIALPPRQRRLFANGMNPNLVKGLHNAGHK